MGKRKTLPSIIAVDDLAGVAVQSTEAERSVEDLQLDAEEYAARSKMLEELFADDEESQMVLMGMSDGLSASEIRSLSGWTEPQYATIRKRMRRRINARISTGWSA